MHRQRGCPSVTHTNRCPLFGVLVATTNSAPGTVPIRKASNATKLTIVGRTSYVQSQVAGSQPQVTGLNGLEGLHATGLILCASKPFSDAHADSANPFDYAKGSLLVVNC